MAQSDRLFSHDIARLYDECLGPMLFEPYAEDLAARIAAARPHDILETAAGTGLVALKMASRMPQAKITATDLNPGMLEVAAAKDDAAAISWQACDACDLPFAAERFDVVACQFGAMFFPDKVQAYGEARRVLRPGGRFIFNAWDDVALSPVPEAVLDELAEIFPNDPPSFLRRIPHGYHDNQAIAAALCEVGFHDITIDGLTLPCRVASPRQAARGFCLGTPTRNELEAREPGGLEAIASRVEKAIARRFGTDAFESSMRAYVVTARK